MQTTPIQPMQRPAPAVHAPVAAIDVPPCYGVCCNLHHTCAHYARVDGADPAGIFMADCGPEHAAFSAGAT